MKTQTAVAAVSSAVLRGDVYMCELKQGKGSEQAKDRPVVVLQNNIGNKYSPTTIVAIISKGKRNKSYPMHVSLPKGVGGVYEDSTVFLEQIETVDKVRLKYKLGDLRDHSDTMKQVNAAAKLSLDLD